LEVLVVILLFILALGVPQFRAAMGWTVLVTAGLIAGGYLWITDQIF